MSGHTGLQKKGKFSGKYKITRRETGQEVDGAFVIRPVTDVAARVALVTYAEATHNPRLGRDIRKWLKELRKGE